MVNDHGEVFLMIGNDSAFLVGEGTCDTCRYIFTKVYNAQSLTDGTPAEVAERISLALRDVNGMPDNTALRELGFVLAPGNYSVVLVSLTPSLVMPGDPNDYFATEAIATWGVDPYFGVGHSPQTPYYRLGKADLGPAPYGNKRLGVVLGVPLYPPTQELMNRQDVIAEYRAALRERTTRPTVFALGLVDDRGPAAFEEPPPEFSCHTIVTLFILDGHHKIAAAALERVAIQILAFLPHDHLVS